MRQGLRTSGWLLAAGAILYVIGELFSAGRRLSWEITLWGILAGLMRFVPFVGSIIAAFFARPNEFSLLLFVFRDEN